MIEEFCEKQVATFLLDGFRFFFFFLSFPNQKLETGKKKRKRKRCYHTDMESLAGKEDTEGKGGQAS